MQQMFKEMIEKLKGQYTQNDLDILKRIEDSLKLDEFNSDIALEIGRKIVACSKKYNEDLIVKITRCKDNETVFLYMGDSKTSRNIGFADMKANVSKMTGHSSIYPLVHKVVLDGFDEVFEDGSNCLPVAGAFPLYAGEKMEGIVAVSGMHNGLDHIVIIEGLKEYLNKEVEEFKGVLI